ncbi:MAG TPA: histidine kinase dimerization/phosphoacceptor domain-containing protein [Ktedonobacteraceae bacterium]
MARELHDTLTQDLVSLVLQLEAADARLASEQPLRAREIVQLTLQCARATLGETRLAIYDLRGGR